MNMTDTEVNEMTEVSEVPEEQAFAAEDTSAETGGESGGTPAPQNAPPGTGQTAQPADVPHEANAFSGLGDLLTSRHEELLACFEGLTDELKTISGQLSAANRAVAVHEEIERNLNNELQRYKNDFYDKLASPFLMQFIGLYCDMTDECDEIRADIEENPENENLKTQLKSLEYYADSIRGVLTNNSVEIKTPQPGDKYNYLEQRISKTVSSDDPELKDCIAKVRSSAFVYNGKVLRPAKVIVYKVK